MRTASGTPIRLVDTPIVSQEYENKVRVVMPFVDGTDLERNDPRIQEIQKALEAYIHSKNPNSQVQPRHIQAPNIRVTSE